MNNNLSRIYRILFVGFFLISSLQPITGQEKKVKKETKTPVQIEIVNTEGLPVSKAKIVSSKNRHTYTVDGSGKGTISLYKDDKIKITAEGYATQTMSVSQLEAGKVTMKTIVGYTGDESRIYTPFGETNERRTVGAYSKVKGEDLEANPTTNMMNALNGRLNGLFSMDNAIISNTMDQGLTNNTSFVRTPLGNIIILVDGVERSLDYIEPETVESVQLLKDASLKALYGGIQTNGILMVKTKRGKKYENKVRVNVQTGIQKPTRLPKYLNAYEYTSMYNQALINSGQAPYFKNPGNYVNGDPVLYPDIDYYEMFLNSNMGITKANAQFTGGNEKTSFFTHVGFQTNGGLEKYTKYPNNDQTFTLRGNVDNTIKDFITFKAGFNAALRNKQWPNMSTQTFFNLLSDTRPNEFPIFIPGDKAGKPDTEFVLGGTAENQNNVYGMLMNNGYREGEYSYIQSDMTLDIDLNKWVQGLVIKPSVTFDVYTAMTSSQGGTFSVFEPVMNQDRSEVTGYKIWGKDTRETNKTRTSDVTQRNFAYNVTATYNRKFGEHDINALIVYFQQTKEYNSLIQKLKRQNIGGNINYMYSDRYIADLSVNYVGVGSFAPDKRFGTFPTFGAGWILSEESFMKNIPWLDYLKLRASYGILGSTAYTADGLFSAYLYRDVWERGGAHADLNGLNNIARPYQTGNPDIGFQKSYEFNIGADFLLLNRSLSLSAGYFNNKLKGALANLTDITPGVIGKGPALVMRNYKDYVSKGFEAEFLYQKKFGELQVAAGANITYGKTDITKEANPDYPAGYEGLLKIQAMGDIQGLRVTGTFADQNEIDKAPVQLFGTVVPGDFRYEDTNNDGFIDDRDRTVIANTSPSVEYGITIKLAYKGFNLDLLGYGLAGFDRVLDNKYYQIYGNRKYSNVLKDGLPNGNPHPVLRAEYSNNNFKTSDYWVVDGSFFKLRNVELGYTLPHITTSKFGINNLKFFARGANLFTISKIKDLDPESLSAGVSNFPLCMTLTGGLSFSF
ncbi:SusC/RagA family TonB-linked outer membrane protein [Dysgonomonas termitidis]|uniref:SusC/RagA family TonB-linked outer membrane protein n=1 Tax=Dysgonomonas termitidis TaxID=1516126 RepID=A0ABV9L3Y0_9BACT